MPLETGSTPQIIEALPGEKIFKVVLRALHERATSGVDVILKVEILGKKKEVLITDKSTQASVSQALQP